MLALEEIAGMIDHALLAPQLSLKEVREGCAQAKEWGVASVCVRSCDVAIAHEELAGSAVRVCSVIGFPHGAQSTQVKLFEALGALEDGAVELDMVLNIGALREGNTDDVFLEIQAITQAAHEQNAKVKVIFENCYLSERQKITACELSNEAGVDWIKTSTGFGPGGATESDLRLMREHADESVQVKASGGIRTLDQLLTAREIGCTRVGTTSTAAILQEAQVRLGGAR